MCVGLCVFLVVGNLRARAGGGRRRRQSGGPLCKCARQDLLLKALEKLHNLSPAESWGLKLVGGATMLEFEGFLK